MGGAAKASDSVRLFLAPGMGHCGGGEGPNVFDKVGALEEWVEQGKAPGQADRIAQHGRQGGSHASAVPVSAGRADTTARAASTTPPTSSVVSLPILRRLHVPFHDVEDEVRDHFRLLSRSRGECPSSRTSRPTTQSSLAGSLPADVHRERVARSCDVEFQHVVRVVGRRGTVGAHVLRQELRRHLHGASSCRRTLCRRGAPRLSGSRCRRIRASRRPSRYPRGPATLNGRVIDLRIVEPTSDVEMAERLARQALGGPQRLAVRMAAEVEP